MIKLLKTADKPFEFQRGTSLRLPLIIKYDNDIPFDLTDYTVHFTMKPDNKDLSLGGDWDYNDDRACIAKDVISEAPETGKVYIDLNPKDLWLDEGLYFFDIQLTHIDKNSITRICTLKALIIPGPTNRTVWDSGDESNFIEDLIEATITEDKNIIIGIVPLITEPLPRLVYGILSKPNYLVSYKDDDEKQNWPIIHSYSCREEYPFELDFYADHTSYKVHWANNTYQPNEPAVQDISINANELTIKLKDEYKRVYVSESGEYSDPATINGMNPIGKSPQSFVVPRGYNNSYRIDEMSNEFTIKLENNAKNGNARIHFIADPNQSTRKLIIEFAYHWPQPDIITPQKGFIFGNIKYYDVEGELDD